VRGFRPAVDTRSATTPAASARTYAQLRRKILHGVLLPGQVINETEVADGLGVSRTPVREALRTLINDGLVEEGPRRQNVVIRLTAEARREIELLVDSLQALTGPEAVRQIDSDGLDQLQLIHIRSRRAMTEGRRPQFLDENDAFNLQLARIAQLHLVEDSLRRLLALHRVAQIDQPMTAVDMRSLVRRQASIINALQRADQTDLLRNLVRTAAASRVRPPPPSG
jgi:GntR family transcriptional regulator, rspAB operon transcriptional repressor